MPGNALIAAVTVALLCGLSCASTSSSSSLGPPQGGFFARFAPTDPPRFVVSMAASAPALAPLTPDFSAAPWRGVVDDDDVEVDGDGFFTLGDGLPLYPLRHAGVRGHWVLDGRIGDRPVSVVFDSGASRSLISPALASSLGLDVTAGAAVRDAVGGTSDAGTVQLPRVVVAGVAFDDLVAVVPDKAHNDELFLLGADVMQRVDIVVDALLGAIAIVPAGVPLDDVHGGVGLGDANIVNLDIGKDGRLELAGSARGRVGIRPFPLIVDTGAPITSVPTLVGLQAGFTADHRRRAIVRGATGAADELRGRFHLAPMSIGVLTVGDVSAVESRDKRGRLGLDVLSRGRVLLSPARRAMVFFPALAVAKKHIKAVAPREPDALMRVAHRARRRITRRHCQAWFAHCGFRC